MDLTVSEPTAALFLGFSHSFLLFFRLLPVLLHSFPPSLNIIDLGSLQPLAFKVASFNTFGNEVAGQ